MIIWRKIAREKESVRDMLFFFRHMYFRRIYDQHVCAHCLSASLVFFLSFAPSPSHILALSLPPLLLRMHTRARALSLFLSCALAFSLHTHTYSLSLSLSFSLVFFLPHTHTHTHAHSYTLAHTQSITHIHTHTHKHTPQLAHDAITALEAHVRHTCHVRALQMHTTHTLLAECAQVFEAFLHVIHTYRSFADGYADIWLFCA